MKKLLVFAGWAISGFFLVIALVSLFSGFTKLTLGIIVWGLTFFPPLWKKTMTIKYGAIANIAMRIVAAIVAPFVGYLITPGDVPEKAQVAVVSKQPVKTIEKVTPEPEPAKIAVAKPEQPTKAVEPEITQCEKDVKFASEVDRMHDTHSDIYPAIESCGSTGDFVAAVNKYPIATNGTEPKYYLTNLCSHEEVLGRGICKNIANSTETKKIHYLSLNEDSTYPVPVGDKASLLAMNSALMNQDRDMYVQIVTTDNVFQVRDEPVDVLKYDGELAQIRLHAIDVAGNDLEGKVMWTVAKFVRTSYSYAN
jgi:hypothetical protein